MQRLQFVLFQIDEAKGYIVDGPLPALRVALILLDNAAEVLLDRWIEQDIEDDTLSESIQIRAREAGIPESHPQFVDLYQRRSLTGKEKKKVGRLFDEKVRYVTQIKCKVPLPIGAVLSHFHRYRNEAHHSARVRSETARTSGMILLDLCCRLIELLGPVSAGYNSSEDFSWLQSRFKLKPHDLWNEGTMAAVLAEFRHGVPIGDAVLRDTLAKNLENRLEDLNDGLEFISTETQVAVDRAAALAESQKFALAESMKSALYRGTPLGLDGPVSIRQLEDLKSVPERVRSSSDSLTGFKTYADADTELERIEFMVEHLVGAIDAEIQLAIDHARGK